MYVRNRIGTFPPRRQFVIISRPFIKDSNSKPTEIIHRIRGICGGKVPSLVRTTTIILKNKTFKPFILSQNLNCIFVGKYRELWFDFASEAICKLNSPYES